MRIAKVEAFAIRLERAAKWDENRAVDEVQDVGDYYIAKNAWTSIYAKRHLETTLVRIETDTGIVGWGEAFSPVSCRTTKTIVEDLCRTVVIGHDPLDVEYLWYRTYSAMRERGHVTGFFIDALSGVDQALYDIIGKALNQPAHRLLGGRFRDRIRVYAGFGGDDPARMAAQAEELVGYGYTALKLHLRPPNRELVEIVRAVRDAVGPRVELMVDVHTTRDVSQAIALGRRLQELDVRWLESPTAPEDVAGQAEIARALDLQVASGEWLRTAYEWLPWLQRRGLDCAMPDIGRTGLSEGKRIAAMCDAFNVPVAPHVGAGGILAIAAGIQLSAAIPRFQILEHGHHAHALKASIASDYPQPVDGHFVLDGKPGLGVTVDEDKIAAVVVT